MRNERRCTAMSKRSRQRCRRAAILGHHVCPFHSGKAPQVQRAAAERLAALVAPSFNAMQRALKSNDIGAAVRAARDVLDRSGIRPDSYSGAEVRQMVRSVSAIVLGNVSDPAELAAISRELKLLLSRNGDREGAAGIPAPPPPAPRPALPDPPPRRHVAEMEIL